MRGKDFFREMETIAAPIGKETYEGTRATYSNLNEDQKFRLLCQLWWIEAPTIANFSRSWWNAIPRDPSGKYRDVEMFLARQMYDESRHGKLYADACIRKGFVQREEELWTHPYARPVQGWLNFAAWLEHLGNYHFTTLYAGEQMASECLTFPKFLEGAIAAIEDPIVRWVFEAQEDEESFHGMTGRYVVTKYCQTQLQQDEAAWAAQTTWKLLGQAAVDLAQFVKEGESMERPPLEQHPAFAPPAKPLPKMFPKTLDHPEV
ncbi:MAG: hypothetical protein QOD06_2377 [Candidatus Binatota bacterium]|nr:hypothetical protein [Candidatus Binatota bacterium]